VFLAAQLLNAANVFGAARDGYFDRKAADAFLSFSAVLIKIPGINQWWRRQRAVMDREFADQLEMLAAREVLQPLNEIYPWYNLETNDAVGS